MQSTTNPEEITQYIKAQNVSTPRELVDIIGVFIDSKRDHHKRYDEISYEDLHKALNESRARLYSARNREDKIYMAVGFDNIEILVDFCNRSLEPLPPRERSTFAAMLMAERAGGDILSPG